MVEATSSLAKLEPNKLSVAVVVPMFNPPVSSERDVVVDRSDPTVSCDVVAIIPVPKELAVKIPFVAAKKDIARVPEVVTGEPETENPTGTVWATDVTVPTF